MATHTHSGGPTLNWGEEVRIDPVYLESFVKKLADALIVAWQRMADSQLAFGEEQLQGVSFIRVYRMKDGSLKTNPGCGNPEAAAPVGQVDPAVSVLSVQAEWTPGRSGRKLCLPSSGSRGTAHQRRLSSASSHSR